MLTYTITSKKKGCTNIYPLGNFPIGVLNSPPSLYCRLIVSPDLHPVLFLCCAESHATLPAACHVSVAERAVRQPGPATFTSTRLAPLGSYTSRISQGHYSFYGNSTFGDVTNTAFQLHTVRSTGLSPLPKTLSSFPENECIKSNDIFHKGYIILHLYKSKQ